MTFELRFGDDSLGQPTRTSIVIGADECGYGSIAGPLVVCAVAVRASSIALITATDSKRYAHDKLFVALERNRKYILGSCIITFDPETLCRIGYNRALAFAYRSAIGTVRRRLPPHFPYAYLDGSTNHSIRFSEAIVKGDARHRAISLASVMGKAYQIRAMRALHATYPEYLFDSHHGYATDGHLRKLDQYGAVVGVHRIPIIARMFGRKRKTLRTRHPNAFI